MKPRKRHYSTTTGHAAGVDILIRKPDGRAVCNVIALSTFDDGSGIKQAEADAALIVAALNAFAGVAPLQPAETIGGERQETLERAG